MCNGSLRRRVSSFLHGCGYWSEERNPCKTGSQLPRSHCRAQKWISAEASRRLVENNVAEGGAGGLMRDFGEWSRGFCLGGSCGSKRLELGKEKVGGAAEEEKALSQKLGLTKTKSYYSEGVMQSLGDWGSKTGSGSWQLGKGSSAFDSSRGRKPKGGFVLTWGWRQGWLQP